MPSLFFQRGEIDAVDRDGRSACGLDQSQAEHARLMLEGVDPIATQAGVAVGEDRQHRSVLFKGRRKLREIPLAFFVDVQVLLPAIADLEDPVLALGRRKADDQGLVLVFQVDVAVCSACGSLIRKVARKPDFRQLLPRRSWDQLRIPSRTAGTAF